MKNLKIFSWKLFIICFLNLLIFQIYAQSPQIYKTQNQVNNLLDTSSLALLSKYDYNIFEPLIDKKGGSILEASKKGTKRISLVYDQNCMDSLTIDMPGSSAVEFKYNTKATVKNVNYLLDSNTAKTLKEIFLIKDSLLETQNTILLLQAGFLKDIVKLKNDKRKEEKMLKILEAKAHLIWPVFFILSLMASWLTKRIDTVLQYFFIGSTLITFIGTLCYFPSFIWLLYLG